MTNVWILLRGAAEIDRKQAEIKQVMNLAAKALHEMLVSVPREGLDLCEINHRFKW